ncbi:MAG: glycosyltransferase [bacterium]|nr:glycosyltransferase [bacterium]
MTSPILILSGHRTGSSAVTGLLHACGLHLGDTIPATSDNSRGYFENSGVLQASRDILARRTRDWTCPPQNLVAKPDDVDDVTRALTKLANPNGVWGFKDPRSLFLLPAWLEVLPEIQIIGVVRSQEATAASINARDGIPLDQAGRIASLHQERLVQLSNTLRFPIVEFGTDLAAVRNSVKAVVDQINELSWDEEAVSGFLDSSLIHQTQAGDDSAAQQQLEPVVPIPAATVQRALAGLVAEEDPPQLIHGPAYKHRQLDDWTGATTLRPETGLVFDLAPAPRADTRAIGPADVASLTLSGLQARNESEEPASHVIATDVLETVSPSELADFLHSLAMATDDDGVAAISGFMIDGAHLPLRQSWSEAEITTFSEKQPFLHHRTHVESALLSSPWTLGGIKDTAGGRTQLLLVKSAERRGANAKLGFEFRTSVHDQLVETREKLRNDIREAGTANKALAAHLSETRQRARDLELERNRERTQLADVREQERATREQLATTKEQHRQALARQDQANARTKALEAQLKKMRASRDAARTDLRRLRSRRSVRAALAIAATFRPVFGWVRGGRKRQARNAGTSDSKSERVPSRKDRAARVDLVRSMRPETGPVDGRLVSIIVTTRNGLCHLERLLPGLESNTTYRSFELVVVDNGSSDGTVEYLTGSWSFPVRVVRNDSNRSFSAANNQGIAAANGELVLLLNNDTEPINPGWLGSMVNELQESENVAAVGALLIYSDRSGSGDEITYPSFSVQHRGVGFGWRNGHPWAFNLGGGEDPSLSELTESCDIPAVTAACLLARMETLLEVGAFNENYVYGSEDVDLCLKMRAMGKTIRLCGHAALYHHEFGTQDELTREVKRINRTGNQRHFLETWSPRLSRSLLIDKFSERHRWTSSRTRVVAITLTKDDKAGGWGDWYTAHELGDAFAALGWDVVYAERFKDRWYDLPDNVDLLISLLDSFDVRRAPASAITVAWVRNWLERWMDHPWFENFDEVAVSSSYAASQIEAGSKYSPHVVPIATNPERFSPGPPDPTFGSDFTFTGNFWGEGRSLIDSLLLRPSERFLLFGKGWEQVPRAQRYWRGELGYERLPLAYRSAMIVLDDTASPTLPHGFLNSRVFDALATGTLVITDNQKGSDDVFGGALPAYSTRAELRSLMDTYLNDDDARNSLANRLRDDIVTNHTYAKRAGQFVEIARGATTKPRLALKIGPPNWDAAPTWGDTHFATHFARALGRIGFATDVHVLSEWDAPDKQDFDIVVHLRGLAPYVPKPGHFNILWIISHPRDVSVEECNRYDLVLVASAAFADELRAQLSVPVEVMLQATDTNLFKPDTTLVKNSGNVVFVGNSRGQHRNAVKWALEQNIPLEIYGGDWDQIIGAGYAKDPVPNDQLPGLYQSAAILVNDHWEDMAEKGFVSNRVFDALACGAFVISDWVAGMDDLFGEAVPMYKNAEELKELTELYAHDPEGRTELRTKGANTVRANHSFEARATDFVALLTHQLGGRRFAVEPELGELVVGD